MQHSCKETGGRNSTRRGQIRLVTGPGAEIGGMIPELRACGSCCVSTGQKLCLCHYATAEFCRFMHLKVLNQNLTFHFEVENPSAFSSKFSVLPTVLVCTPTSRHSLTFSTPKRQFQKFIQTAS